MKTTYFVVFAIALLCLAQLSNCGYVVYRAYWGPEHAQQSTCGGQPDNISIYSSSNSGTCSGVITQTCSVTSTDHRFTSYCVETNDLVNLVPNWQGKWVEVRLGTSSTLPTVCDASVLPGSSLIGWFKEGSCAKSFYYSGYRSRASFNSSSAEVRLNCGSMECESGCSYKGSTSVMSADFACVSTNGVYNILRMVGTPMTQAPAAVYYLKYNSTTSCPTNEDPLYIYPSTSDIPIKSFPGNDTVILDTCSAGIQMAFVKLPSEDAPFLYDSNFPFPFKSTYLEVRDAGIKQACPVTVPFAHRLEQFVRSDYCGSNFGVVAFNTSTGVDFGDQCTTLPGFCSKGCFYNYKAKYSDHGMACSDDNYGTKKIFGLWSNGKRVEFTLPAFPPKIGVRSVVPGPGPISNTSVTSVSTILIMALLIVFML